jgi:hypothetical protein
VNAGATSKEGRHPERSEGPPYLLLPLPVLFLVTHTKAQHLKPSPLLALTISR